jgi:hypothetical protein
MLATDTLTVLVPVTDDTIAVGAIPVPVADIPTTIPVVEFTVKLVVPFPPPEPVLVVEAELK